MKLSTALHVIKDLVEKTPDKDIRCHLAHAIEELGEVSDAARQVRKADGNGTLDQYLDTSRHLIEETVDNLIAGLALFVAAGGTEDDFDSLFKLKTSKWYANLK